MEKKKSKILIIILAVIVILAAVCFFVKPIYYRIYPFDRVKGEVRLLINGVPTDLSQSNISPAMKNTDKVKVTVNDGAAAVSMRANSYGSHEFVVDTGKIKAPIYINAYQSNWWNVMTFSVDINIDETAKQVEVSGKYTDINDNGSKYESTYNETFDYKDSEEDSLIKVQLGP